MSLHQTDQVLPREQVDTALRSRAVAVIDQALGILMAQQRCTARDAFDLLRQASQHRNRKLRDVAADVVTTVSGRTPEASSFDRAVLDIGGLANPAAGSRAVPERRRERAWFTLAGGDGATPYRANAPSAAAPAAGILEGRCIGSRRADTDAAGALLMQTSQVTVTTRRDRPAVGAGEVKPSTAARSSAAINRGRVRGGPHVLDLTGPPPRPTPVPGPNRPDWSRTC